MEKNILVPSLGESVNQVQIAKWHKKNGDFVKKDEALLDLETEKIGLEVVASVSGILSIAQNQGATVTPGQIIGIIEEKSEEHTVESQKDSDKFLDKSDILSPVVKKLVAENNFFAKSISGTGKDGRIVKEDILKLIEKNKMDAQIQTSSVILTDRIERVPMNSLRKTIAKRLKDAQNQAAILTTINEIDMSEVIKLRTNFKDTFEKIHGVRLGFMSFFVKAALNGLKKLPIINAQIDGNDIIYNNYYDIGVAVGTEAGLVVPILRQVDTLNFAQIETQISNYGKAAKEGRLSMDDLRGGTFTISNGGVYGSLLSTPIINPPQSAILGLHKIQERPAAINGNMEIRPMMYVALSYDHRLIDGKDAVGFLITIKELIENPIKIMLEI